MPFNNDYHKEPGHGFVDKVAALAKFAGITAIALGSTPFIAKGAGALSRSFAANLTEESGALRKIIGKMAGLEDSRIIMSDSFNFLSDQVPRVKRAFYTNASKAERQGALLSSLRSQVHESSYEAFDAQHTHIAEVLKDYMTGDYGRISDNLLSDTVVKRFMESTKGIQFKNIQAKLGPDLLSEHRKLVNTAINDALEVERSKITSGKMFTGASGDRNFEVIHGSIVGELNKQNALSRKFNKLMGHDRHLKPLTIADLTGEHRGAVESYLESTGHHAPTVPGETRVDVLLKKAKSGVHDLFYDSGGNFLGSNNAEEELNAAINATHTGLVVGKDGRVFSLAHEKNVFRGVGRALRNEIQIPLVPYRFNIPGTLGQFMVPDSAGVKNLGSMGGAGFAELRRMGLTSSFGEDAFGVSIGDRVLGFNIHRDGAVNYEVSELANQNAQRFLFLNNQRSNSLKHYVSSRNLTPNNQVVDAVETLKNKGMVGGLKELLLGNDATAHSVFNKAHANYQPNLYDMGYSEGHGLTLQPRNEAGALAGGVFHQPMTGLTSTDIHPVTISRFLSSSGADKLPEEVRLDLYRRVMGSLSSDRKDISGVLKGLADKVASGDIAISKGEYSDHLLKLMSVSDNPRSLLDALEDTSILGDTSALSRNASEDFSRSVSRVMDDPARLFDNPRVDVGFVKKQQNLTLGDPNEISTLHSDVQRGLLTEFGRQFGLHNLENAAGMSGTELLLNSVSRPLSTNSQAASLLASQLGITVDEAESLVSKTVFRGKNVAGEVEPTVNNSLLGELGLAFSDLSALQPHIEDKHALTLLANSERINAQLLGSRVGRLDAAARITDRLYSAIDAPGQLKEFSGVLGRSMAEASEDEVSRFTVLPAFGPGIGSSFIDGTQGLPNQAVNQLKRGFGLPDFIRGAFDPNHPQGYVGSVASILSDMSNNIGAEIGLGLTQQDTSTIARSHIATLTKRVIPLFIGLEVYKNVNASAHHYGFMGMDDMSANALANVNLSSARFKDKTGLTAAHKHLVYGTPGLDMYFHPRSEDEYREHLFYGEEEVRRGRGFIIGNRQQATGGAVDYIRPSFYRRWKSHWTEADNSQLSNPEYSFLPNPVNIFSPIKRLLHPKWREELTSKDRPYASLDEMMEFGDMGPEGYSHKGGYYGVNSEGMGAVSGGSPGGNSANRSGVPGFGGHGGGYSLSNRHRLKYGVNKHISHDALKHSEHVGEISSIIDETITPMGFYGGVIKMLPHTSGDDVPFSIQDPKKSFSSKHLLFSGDYGESSWLFGEYFRRFIHDPRQDPDAFNPLPNSQPSFLAKTRFSAGDAYVRTPQGELSLPGDAYQRSHPYVKTLKGRGSMIGHTEDEIVAKLLDPVGSGNTDYAEQIMSYGSYGHKVIMQKMNDEGILIGAEVSGYDDEHNVSATIDALIRGKTGIEVAEIKTRNSKGIHEDPDQYVDQLMFYMHLVGAKQGHLIKVNRDNPSEVITSTYKFDAERLQKVFDRLDRARATVQGMVDEGSVSPYETYGLLERIEILARVAPDSYEFRKLVEDADTKGSFGGMEERRFQMAKKNAQSMRNTYNLYPYRNPKTETRELKIEGITDDGEVMTQEGIFKLAGVKFDDQAFSYKSAEDVFADFGITVGSRAKVTLIDGQFDSPARAFTQFEALVGNINKDIINSDYAEFDDEDRHPLANKVRRRTGRVKDAILHSDNLFSNKFLRVRSGLEEFERGEVFGTSDYSLKNIPDNYVIPTINSLIGKNPVVAGAMGAITAGMFFRTSEARGKAALIGGIAAASLSLGRSAYETLTGHTWAPSRFKKSSEFEEYYDMLKYVKESTVAERARIIAIHHGKKGKNDAQAELQARAYGSISEDAGRKSRQTMYGFQVASGTLEEALASIPRRHKQIAESIITTGDSKEKKKFYDLLPDNEKRVLGKFLNVDLEDLPDKPSISEYFKQHYLPEANWGGYNADVSLEDIKARAADLENIKIARPSRRRLERAKEYTRDVEVPRMDKPTYRDIRRSLNKLATSGEFGNIVIDYQALPSTSNSVDINLKAVKNRRSEVDHKVNEHIRRA